jgi:teichuronic acid biosynthesis glycosyltransferase TuaC
MRIVAFSTLYPNAARPNHGLFVEARLRHLVASGRVEAKVIAPVPWFPFTHPRFGAYAQHARAPHEEMRHGLEVFHPRYPVIPKVGMTVAPFLLAHAAGRAFERLRTGYEFDLIDAHYFYPDGVAAIMLGQRLGKPVVITARGNDLSLVPRYRLPRRMIAWAAGRAAGLITVCQALQEALVEIGVPAERVTVLRNGVDLTLFQPVDRERFRRQLGFTRLTLLSVGHLIPRKSHDLPIRALPLLPDCDLVVVGQGPQRAALEALARRLRVAERVRFAGVVDQEELKHYYGAADALVLASSREGWANVLLESMACGTPVVASNVWGNPEVVAAPEAGVLMAERTPEALARSVRDLFAKGPDRSATRRYAEGFSWSATTDGQLALFERILASEPAANLSRRDKPASGASAMKLGHSSGEN